MTVGKRWMAILALLLAGCNGKDGSTDGKGPLVAPPRADGLTLVRPPLPEGAPALSRDEAKALFKLVRLDPLQKLSNKLTRENLQELADIPQRLFEKYGDYVIVTLYVPGHDEPLVGAAAGGNLAFSAVGAARSALGDQPPGLLQTARVKIDLLCSGLEQCGLEGRFLPGIEGLVLLGKNGQPAYLPPDLFLADQPSAEDYVKRLMKAAGQETGPGKKPLGLIMKFRTAAMMEYSAGAEPVFLYRGNALLASPSPAACRLAGRAGLAWLAGAVRPDGRVPAAYYPYENCFEAEKPSVIGQALTALALAKAGPPATPEDRIPPAADKALAFLEKQAARDPRFKFACYLEEGGAGYVGSTALGLLAFCESQQALAVPNAARLALMRQLAEFLLAQQTPEGEFLSHFDLARGRAEKRFAETRFPGQAILALVRLYEFEGRKDERLIAAARKGAKHLLAVGGKPPAEAPPPTAHRLPPTAVLPDSWLMQALAALVRNGDDKEFLEPLLALARESLAAQLKPGKDQLPDLIGAIDERDAPTVAGTASQAEGLLAALPVARKLDAPETLEIEAALRRAAIYVLQNQFRLENSYALPQPERAAGGFRLSVLAGEVRPDGTAHAALFLLEYAALQPGAAEPRR